METFIGLETFTLRALMLLGTIGAIFLFFYKLKCLIDLMSNEELAQKTDNSKLIYAGLITFIPLAAGAFIYEWCVNKFLSKFYLFGLVLVLVPATIMFVHALPHLTNFDLNFLDW